MKFIAVVKLPYDPYTSVKVEFEMDDEKLKGLIDPGPQDVLNLAYEHAKEREEELKDLASDKLANFIGSIKEPDDIEIGLSEIISDFAENAEIDDVDTI